MSDLIKYSNVTVFQDERPVIGDLSVEVKKGEFVYLLGKTGSGKSSFLKTLYADLPLTEGEGNVVDYNLVGLKDDAIPYLRRKLGIVFQDFKLLTDRTVAENLLFVLRATGWTNESDMKNKIDEVLEKVGLSGFSGKMPHQLSGGEQQRVAIARALLNDPEIIIADEPTGNLDPQTSVGVLELLRKINSLGKTIIMATHDYAILMKFPNKTLKCEDGVVFEVMVQKTL